MAHPASITVHATYCFTGLYSTKNVNLMRVLMKQICSIQTGGQSCRETFQCLRNDVGAVIAQCIRLRLPSWVRIPCF